VTDLATHLAKLDGHLARFRDTGILNLIAGHLLSCVEARSGYSLGNEKHDCVPDNRDGTYTNPLIIADSHDPERINIRP